MILLVCIAWQILFDDGDDDVVVSPHALLHSHSHPTTSHPHNEPPSRQVQYGVECNKCRVLVVVSLLWKIVVVLYNGAVLVGMTGWKDDRVKSIRDDVSLSTPTTSMEWNAFSSIFHYRVWD